MYKRGKGKYYKDNPEAVWKRDQTKMFVDGKYIPKSHPLHKPGRYKGFVDAAFSSLKNYTESKQGQIYIMVNPAYPGWCKVGMAIDAEDRVNQFQTGSPFRDYKLFKFFETENRRESEKQAHYILQEKIDDRRGEWFHINPEDAEKILTEFFEKEGDASET